MNVSPQSRADASRLCLYPWQLQPSSPDSAQEESALFAGEKLQIHNPIVLGIDSVWVTTVRHSATHCGDAWESDL
jgi:hypothetical protein